MAVPAPAGAGAAGALAGLQRDGLVQAAADRYALTPARLAWAYRLVRQRRLWEVFLMHEADLGQAPVDRDAAGLLDAVPEPPARELERLLRVHDLEPGLRPLAAAGERAPCQ